MVDGCSKSRQIYYQVEWKDIIPAEYNLTTSYNIQE